MVSSKLRMNIQHHTMIESTMLTKWSCESFKLCIRAAKVSQNTGVSSTCATIQRFFARYRAFGLSQWWWWFSSKLEVARQDLSLKLRVCYAQSCWCRCCSVQAATHHVPLLRLRSVISHFLSAIPIFNSVILCLRDQEKGVLAKGFFGEIRRCLSHCCLCIICTATWHPMRPLATSPYLSALLVCLSSICCFKGCQPSTKMQNHLCMSKVCLCRLPCAS